MPTTSARATRSVVSSTPWNRTWPGPYRSPCAFSSRLCNVARGLMSTTSTEAQVAADSCSIIPAPMSTTASSGCRNDRSVGAETLNPRSSSSVGAFSSQDNALAIASATLRASDACAEAPWLFAASAAEAPSRNSWAMALSARMPKRHFMLRMCSKSSAPYTACWPLNVNARPARPSESSTTAHRAAKHSCSMTGTLPSGQVRERVASMSSRRFAGALAAIMRVLPRIARASRSSRRGRDLLSS